MPDIVPTLATRKAFNEDMERGSKAFPALAGPDTAVKPVRSLAGHFAADSQLNIGLEFVLEFFRTFALLVRTLSLGCIVPFWCRATTLNMRSGVTSRRCFGRSPGLCHD